MAVGRAPPRSLRLTKGPALATFLSLSHPVTPALVLPARSVLAGGGGAEEGVSLRSLLSRQDFPASSLLVAAAAQSASERLPVIHQRCCCPFMLHRNSASPLNPSSHLQIT